MAKQILIATTNKDKLREIRHEWADLDFELLGLDDISPIEEPEETEPTIEGNAILKARYYAEHSGMITLADDSGLFIHALNDWPGVISARVGTSNHERRKAVIEKMKELDGDEQRAASFRIALALYDPHLNTQHLVYASDHGVITKELPPENHNAFCYDPIFFIPEIGKTYADISLEEKSARSHRGRALKQMRYHLANTYSPKTFVVPLGIVVRERKILMNLRNDPHAPQFHETWEFPGGAIDEGETIEQALLREVQEETGFSVKVLHRFDHIHEVISERSKEVRLYLIPYLCSIVSGESSPPKNEVIRSQWFSLEEVVKQKMIGDNNKLYETIQEKLLELIQSHKDLQ